MEFISIKKGERFPEIYSLGFDGVHIQLFVSEVCWNRFVMLTGEGTLYAEKLGSAFVPPCKEGGAFGAASSALAERELDGTMCIRIAAYTDSPHDDGRARGMAPKVKTLAHILVMMSVIACEMDAAHTTCEDEELSQLFLLNTYEGRGSSNGSWGLECTVSPQARRVLRGLDGEVAHKATIAMCEHYQKYYVYDPRYTPALGDFYLRVENGVIHMKTFGFCSCLGTHPPYTEEEGYHLTSHNVDHASQQLNLLVGLAHVWQAVRARVKSSLPT